MSKSDDLQRSDDEAESADEGWRFALEDVGEEAETHPEAEPLEPGSPSLENAVFVLLGVLLAFGIIFVSL